MLAAPSEDIFRPLRHLLAVTTRLLRGLPGVGLSDMVKLISCMSCSITTIISGCCLISQRISSLLL